jgi:secreted trypsin-like serine protease
MWTSTNEYCKNSGWFKWWITIFLKPNMVCAFRYSNAPYSNMCEGDSGGPLVISKSPYDNTAVIYGIVSKKDDRRVCGEVEEFGAIFTRVSSHLKWIEDVRANTFNEV